MCKIYTFIRAHLFPEHVKFVAFIKLLLIKVTCYFDMAEETKY